MFDVVDLPNGSPLRKVDVVITAQPTPLEKPTHSGNKGFNSRPY